MRAVLIHYTDSAVGVSKHDQVFAEGASFDRRTVSFANLFATHPSTADRVARLMEMEPAR